MNFVRIIVFILAVFAQATANEVSSDECSTNADQQEISLSPSNINTLFKLFFHRTIPSHFENIIIILGQCLHSGSLNHGEPELILYIE